MTVPMLSDSCDKAGLRSQVLENRLSPLSPRSRAAGRARTALFVPDEISEPEKPYDDAIDFIDQTSPGDFLAIATGNSNQSAFWGELFSAAAKGRGAEAVVTDGNVRDSEKIMDLGFPVFARSRRPIDFRGRMKLSESGGTIEIGGVAIAPGDLIVADDDGIVVLPAKQEELILGFARERARGESSVLEELLGGSTLREVWTKHGIL
tara:strand:+ start:442 stop:1062 length:621 start_codon:yes stop_codon:yes gene_type:complete